MKKFEYHADTGYFAIDPGHLAAGLAAAAVKGHTAVRVMAMDYRDQKLGFDAAAFAGQRWIRKLVLDDELTPLREDLSALLELDELEELSLREWMPLDFASFPKLTSLVFVGGASLAGLDRLRSLRELYLIDWKESELPKEVAACTATHVRLSASKKLSRPDRLFKLASLRELTLQHLPKLELPKKAVKLPALERLNVEGVGPRDFSFLKSTSLQELELFTTFDSLAFIKQLPALTRLYIWECLDGDMQPVLSHPGLREIYFDKNRRHYTHKEKQLQKALEHRTP
jgi:hypothetical protein